MPHENYCTINKKDLAHMVQQQLHKVLQRLVATNTITGATTNAVNGSTSSSTGSDTVTLANGNTVTLTSGYANPELQQMVVI